MRVIVGDIVPHVLWGYKGREKKGGRQAVKNFQNRKKSMIIMKPKTAFGETNTAV